MMEHSVAAYLARLPKHKAERLWQEWRGQKELPPYISEEFVEILRKRLEKLSDQQSSP